MICISYTCATFADRDGERLSDPKRFHPSFTPMFDLLHFLMDVDDVQILSTRRPLHDRVSQQTGGSQRSTFVRTSREI